VAADLIGVKQRRAFWASLRQALLQGRDQVDHVAAGGFRRRHLALWPLALSSISFFTSSV